MWKLFKGVLDKLKTRKLERGKGAQRELKISSLVATIALVIYKELLVESGHPLYLILHRPSSFS